jgi:uroporphyrinogen-III synthase
VAGRRVLVGRRDGAGTELSDLLDAVGFTAVPVPLIRVAPPADPGPLRSAVSRLAAGHYAWAAFTSVPAVDAVLGTGAATPGLAVSPATRVAAVGPGTAGALGRAGIHVDLVPGAGGSAAELADAWPSGTGSVLLPRSDIATVDLPDSLRAKGYDVETVVAYRTVEAEVPAHVITELADGGFAAVLLGSASAARSLARFSIAGCTAVVAIGTPTARAAAAAGLAVTTVATRPTAAGLAEATRIAVEPGATTRPAPPPDPTPSHHRPPESEK